MEVPKQYQVVTRGGRFRILFRRKPKAKPQWVPVGGIGPAEFATNRQALNWIDSNIVSRDPDAWEPA